MVEATSPMSPGERGRRTEKFPLRLSRRAGAGGSILTRSGKRVHHVAALNG